MIEKIRNFRLISFFQTIKHLLLFVLLFMFSFGIALNSYAQTSETIDVRFYHPSPGGDYFDIKSGNFQAQRAIIGFGANQLETSDNFDLSTLDSDSVNWDFTVLPPRCTTTHNSNGFQLGDIIVEKAKITKLNVHGQFWVRPINGGVSPWGEPDYQTLTGIGALPAILDFDGWETYWNAVAERTVVMNKCKIYVGDAYFDAGAFNFLAPFQPVGIAGDLDYWVSVLHGLLTGSAIVGFNSTFTEIFIWLLGWLDIAENFIVGDLSIEAGNVVVLDQLSGKLLLAAKEYDPMVAGIISTKPAITLDEVDSSNSKNKRPLALVGTAPCKVDASYAPINIGDFLTTSNTPGYAMKAKVDEISKYNTIIGKALEPLKKGRAEINILLMQR